MELSQLLNVQGQMLLLLAAGAVLKRLGVFKNEAKGVLTDLILDLVLPCNIITSFLVPFNLEILFGFLEIIIVAVLIQAVSMGLSKALYNREEPGRKKVFQYATLVSNAGFMGNPVAEGIFGAEGLMYASIYLIPQRIVMWTAGISCFTQGGSRKELIKKVATHPCIVAVYIGLALMLSQVQLPGFLLASLRSAGGCTTALSMLLIGTIFADIRLRDLVSLPVLRYTLVRLALIPGLTWIGCRLFGVPQLITGVSVLLAGMPAGSTTAILAEKYKGDSVFATKCVVFSTLMTLISVPLWCLVL